MSEGPDAFDIEELSDSEAANIEVQQEMGDIWTTHLLFDSPKEDFYRARVAAEFTRLCDLEGAKNITKGRYAKLDDMAHFNVQRQDAISASASGARSSCRSAARMGKGTGFYSSG